MNKNVKRVIPFAILVILILIVYLTNLHDFLSVDWLQSEQRKLRDYASMHPLLSPLIYIGIYIVSVAIVIPDSTILTLLGGMIFPLPEALLLATFSEVTGATIFFAVFHTLFGTTFVKRERKFFSKLRRGFKNHSASYLLFLRISHVVPFWITNTAAAYFKVPYWTFIWTTLVGVIPITYIVAEAGYSLGNVIAMDQKLSLSDIFTPQVKIALLVIGIIALVPILVKKWMKKRKWKL